MYPIFTLYYESKDITKSVSPYVLSIEYTDNEHGESDELQLIFDDTDKLWQSSWLPSKGDKLKLHIGYENEKLLNCGTFEIDEIEFESPPDSLTVKSLATGIKDSFREINSNGFENKTLKQIINEYANKHNLVVIGNIEDIQVERITQNKETDLKFLTRIAEQYGYIFKITEDKLVFYQVKELTKSNTNIILYKSDLTSVNLSEKTSKQFKAVQVTYFDPKKKKTIKTTVRNENVKKGDTLKITSRVTNKKQATIQANAALNRSNEKITGSFEIIGTPTLVAGINLELKDLSHFSGKYHIKRVRHIFDRNSGYKTNCEIESC